MKFCAVVLSMKVKKSSLDVRIRGPFSHLIVVTKFCDDNAIWFVSSQYE